MQTGENSIIGTRILYHSNSFTVLLFAVKLRLPDVLEGQGLSLNLLSKRAMSLILEKHLVVLEFFPASLKILEYF